MLIKNKVDFPCVDIVIYINNTQETHYMLETKLC